MPYADPAVRKAYRSAYGKTEKWKHYRQRWYLENKEKVLDYNKALELKNLPDVRARRRAWSAKRRAELVQLLGSKCCRCGFVYVRALQIDHVNGGGNLDRKRFGHSPSCLLRDVADSIRAGVKKYQILCANCNWIKRHERMEMFK